MIRPENILPGCEHVQKMRQDLILKLGLLTIAGAEDDTYEETLDQLRRLETPRIHNWDNSDEQWDEILGETYSQGKSYIRFPELPGVSVLYVEDLISKHGGV